MGIYNNKEDIIKALYIYIDSKHRYYEFGEKELRKVVNSSLMHAELKRGMLKKFLAYLMRYRRYTSNNCRGDTRYIFTPKKGAANDNRLLLN